uniref:Uncharacterized protein n=1 Tax=Aegilops tauschii subsp. strangulata TaxID=200361 RepID=A0A453FHQ6_AEGTS
MCSGFQTTTPWRFPGRTNSSKSKITLSDSCQDVICTIAYTRDLMLQATGAERRGWRTRTRRGQEQEEEQYKSCI